MIPKRLRDDKFGFCLIEPDKKKPIGMAWQKNPLKHNSPKISQNLNNGGGVGCVMGFGGIVVRDIDEAPDLVKKLLSKGLDTFAVQSREGRLHLYYICEDAPREKGENSYYVLGNGELRVHSCQCVIPPSLHPATKKPYRVIADKPIKKVSWKTLWKTWGAPYLRESLESDNPPEEKPKDETRSGEEMSFLCKLILKGFSKDECYAKMQIFNKWASSPQAYRDRTYDKAIDFVYSVLKKRKEGKKDSGNDDEENFKQALYYDRDLKNYIPPAQSWLLQGMIPRNEIGVLAGNRETYKTFLMLRLALSLASGKSFLGIAEVPQKCRVLVIDEENGRDELIKRVRGIKKDMGITEDLPIAYLSFYNAKLDTEIKQNRIIKFIEEFKPDLILVDGFARVVSFNVDKENLMIADFFSNFVRPTTIKHNCGWLFVHHYRKMQPNQKWRSDDMDELRGGSELGNIIRFAFGVTKPRNQENQGGEIVIFKQIKLSTATKMKPKVISILGESDKVSIRCEGDAEDVLKTEQLCAQAIKQWILEEGIKGEFKTLEVTEAEPSGYKKTTISAGLKILKTEGFLVQVKRGYWRVAADDSQTKISEDDENLNLDKIEVVKVK